MLDEFQSETLAQGDALRSLIAGYAGAAGDALNAVPRPRRVLLTGMGASYHAAYWGAAVLCGHGIAAVAVEASELMHYKRALLAEELVVFISQSGASAEVEPLLNGSPGPARLMAVTNDPSSPLGAFAHHVLPLFAGTERTVATTTYLNTLACIWLLAHTWSGSDVPAELARLARLAAEVDALLADAQELVADWHPAFASAEHLYFLGHGPHAATARQSAMMMSEVVKRPAIGTGIGDFRHGLIEAADETTGVVLYGSGGRTDASVAALAGELASYGCTVLQVVEGRSRRERATRSFDEALGSLLDVVPAQVFAASTAERLHIDASFRHIRKVIERL
ncbi:MAG TPA: SIS domain-containing protein [Trueperaceae bacterium]